MLVMTMMMTLGSRAKLAKKKRRLSDYCGECKALHILKQIVREGSLLSFGDAKRLLDEKLGPDPNRDQAPGAKKHRGMRNFVLVEWKHWKEPQWMEETGHATLWNNHAGGRCPKPMSDDKEMKIIKSIWVKDWEDIPGWEEYLDSI